MKRMTSLIAATFLTASVASGEFGYFEKMLEENQYLLGTRYDNVDSLQNFHIEDLMTRIKLLEEQNDLFFQIILELTKAKTTYPN